MRSLPDPPSPRWVTAAAAILGLLAALMFAPGWAPGAVLHAGELVGDRISAIGVGQPVATVDAYRRSDSPRRPQPMPAPLVVVAILLAVTLSGPYPLAAGSLGAVVQRRHPTRDSRGPPHLFLP